jgi:crotonobetainyl-CoA:carnitine CoA-transferase CaiB-like acyl-CoA transferase
MATPEEAAQLPLSGIRVVDLGRRLAAPVCGTHLADFGADVIKVEIPDGGDLRRRTRPDEHINGLNPDFAVDNRNKRSVTLDLHSPVGQGLLKRLVGVSDVLLENFRPGTLEKWDLGYGQLFQTNPCLIVARISAYGQTGPHGNRVGEATTTAAYAGHVYINGFPDGPPLRLAAAYGDHLGALFTLYGIMMALRVRDRTGKGQVIDTALYEALFRITGSLVPAYAAHGLIRNRRGNTDTGQPAVGIFLAGDGKYVAVDSGDDRHFARWAERIGRLDMVDNPGYENVKDRIEHGPEIDEMITQWIGDRTGQEVVAVLQELGIPSDVVNSAKDIYDEPHYHERGSIVPVEIAGGSTMYMPGLQPHLSETPGRIEKFNLGLGEHNDEVYQGLLGMSPAELAALKDDGVI